jgi:hypothetical protein
VDWLPADATNISYYRSYSWTAYEFDIPQPAFLRWAGPWSPKPLRTPMSIPRFSYFSDHRSVEVAVGFGYASPMASNGGRILVAYDTASGRAYFQSNPR